MIRAMAPALLGEVLSGKLQLLEPLMELLPPPLAFHVLRLLSAYSVFSLTYDLKNMT